MSGGPGARQLATNGPGNVSCSLGRPGQGHEVVNILCVNETSGQIRGGSTFDEKVVGGDLGGPCADGLVDGL
eukprot:4826013-Pyramimonas_sp.AAC.1